MFQSPSFTHRPLHRLRTTASRLWLHVAPHSTLAGCRYRFELSIDPRFPEVPAFPGFPSTPCTVTSASEAILCGRRYALSIRPAGRSCPTFTINQVTGPFPAQRRFTVAQLQFGFASFVTQYAASGLAMILRG